MPLVRRLPHLRGFTNIWRVEFKPVNLARLEDFTADSEVTPATLASAGIIKKATDRVAILAEGDIDRPLKIKAHRVSKAAQDKIVAAGGTVEIIEL